MYKFSGIFRRLQYEQKVIEKKETGEKEVRFLSKKKVTHTLL